MGKLITGELVRREDLVRAVNESADTIDEALPNLGVEDVSAAEYRDRVAMRCTAFERVLDELLTYEYKSDRKKS